MTNTMKIYKGGELVEIIHPRNAIGSNQYQTKKRHQTKVVIFACTTLLLTFFGIVQGISIIMTPDLISPIPAHAQEREVKESINIHPTATPQPSITPEPKSKQYEEIDAEIHRVFGKYYEKAIILLKGKGPGTCRENFALNPLAENKNMDAEGHIKSIDYGVFQINGYWQGFRHLGKAEQFLLDPEINIRVAWSIYEADGYSFKAWSCGKAYGI